MNRLYCAVVSPCTFKQQIVQTRRIVRLHASTGKSTQPSNIIIHETS
jgi:hypothetical protein